MFSYSRLLFLRVFQALFIVTRLNCIFVFQSSWAPMPKIIMHVNVPCAGPVGGSMCSAGAEGEERLCPKRPRGVPGCTADAAAADDRWAHHLCWVGV